MTAPRAGGPITTLYMDIGDGWRGGQRQILWMAQRLKRAGHRPLMALRPNVPLAKRSAESGIEVIPIDPRWPEVGPWTVMRLRRIIRRERVDIVHPQSGHTLALAALATLGSRVKLVMARRVTFPLRRNAGTFWKYDSADRIIAISKAAAQGILDRGIDPAKVVIIPSGVDLSRDLTPAGAETLEALGVPRGAPLVVQVAALVTMKDPLTFVRAMDVARRRVPELRALMLGDGHLRGEVEAEVARLGLGGHVIVAGFRADADAIMAAADVVTLSSGPVGEALGTVIADALSMGKPVAITAAPGVTEVVRHDVEGRVAPVGDHAALGEAVATLLTDRALAARYGVAGRLRAREYDIERTASRTIDVYRELLGR